MRSQRQRGFSSILESKLSYPHSSTPRPRAQGAGSVRSRGDPYPAAEPDVVWRGVGALKPRRGGKMEENPRASSSGKSVVVLPAWIAHALAHYVLGEIWATAPDAVMPAYPTDDARRFVVSIDNRLAPLTAIILPCLRLNDPNGRSLPARSHWRRWRRSLDDHRCRFGWRRWLGRRWHRH